MRRRPLLPQRARRRTPSSYSPRLSRERHLCLAHRSTVSEATFFFHARVPFSFLDESYLASIATKVGVPISASPRSVSTGSPTPPPLAVPPEIETPSPSSADKETTSPDQARRAKKSKKEDATHAVPIVFHWDHGGNDVYVSGSFNNWEKIPMNRRCVCATSLMLYLDCSIYSRDNFSTIVELPQGTHEYKFYVDGHWLHDTIEVE